MADDQEVIEYLDGLFGTESSEPEGQRDESEQPEAEADSPFFRDEFDEEPDETGEEEEEVEEDDEEEDDSEGEDEGDDEDVPDEDDPKIDPREARLKAIAEAVERKQQEAAKLIKYEQTVNKFQQIKANSTDEEWATFTNQFLKFVQNKEVQKVEKQLHDQQVIVAAYQMNAQLEQQAAEYAAGQELAIIAATEKLGSLSAYEERMLRSANDENFIDTFNFIVKTRQEQTEPARKALREKRQAKGADRPPIRENGGARSVAKDYNNFEDIGSYMDDVIPAGALG